MSLKVFSSFKCWLLESLWSLCTRSHCPQREIIWLLILLAEISRIIRRKQSYLIPNFNRNVLNFSLFSIMLAMNFLHISFTMLRYVPPILDFFPGFYHGSMLYFIKFFFIYWDDHVIKSMSFLIWCNTLIDFLCWAIISSLYEAHLVTGKTLMYCWIQFTSIENFCSNVHPGN